MSDSTPHHLKAKYAWRELARTGLPKRSAAERAADFLEIYGAYDESTKRGYAVTVFDSRLLPGGLLVNGVPAFKLDKSIVQRRIEILKKRGVSFRLGVAVGQDIELSGLRAG